jgi:tetratricopeptide (TPR) repeat protein
MTEDMPASLAEEAKRLYERREYERAAGLFLRAAQASSRAGDDLMAAELNNNRSVSLLQAGKAKEALQAAQGTDQVFAAASDPKRQAMALGNQAAALEALHRMDEAFETYGRSALLFEQAGEGDMQALVKKSMAAIQLKRGRLVESAFNMVGSVEAKARPSLFERFLRFLLRFKPW